jgi:hypothetical protein
VLMRRYQKEKNKIRKAFKIRRRHYGQNFPILTGATFIV